VRTNPLHFSFLPAPFHFMSPDAILNIIEAQDHAKPCPRVCTGVLASYKRQTSRFTRAAAHYRASYRVCHHCRYSSSLRPSTSLTPPDSSYPLSTYPSQSPTYSLPKHHLLFPRAPRHSTSTMAGNPVPIPAKTGPHAKILCIDDLRIAATEKLPAGARGKPPVQPSQTL